MSRRSARSNPKFAWIEAEQPKPQGRRVGASTRPEHLCSPPFFPAPEARFTPPGPRALRVHAAEQKRSSRAQWGAQAFGIRQRLFDRRRHFGRRHQGLLGIAIGWVEGLEINVLSAVAGIDIRRPALKLPGLGRLGVAQSSRRCSEPTV
jgi:hypothetical protein